jgi:circadian clock protein KaiC
LYLITGDPGSGKTTLGIQFLQQGVRAGEAGLYITLSESEEELRQVARAHHWSLDGITVFELLLPLEESLKAEEQYTILHPSEVEFSDTIRSILTRIDEVQPRRVVFDSLTELRLLAREPLRYRRQILALKQSFSGRSCTVLMLDDSTGDVQSISHGVVQLESLARDYGTERRRLRVQKLRGVRFREGFHDYHIRTGGVEVFPRLVAAEYRTQFSHELVESGIAELDALLGGGLKRGTNTLLLGPAGSGKSTISLLYAVAAAARGEPAAFFTFDEGLSTIIRRAEGLGMNIHALVDTGRLQVEVVDPAELSPGQFVSRMRVCVEKENMRVLVIDSLNGLLAAMRNEQHLVVQLHEILFYLNGRGITTLLTLAQYGILGQGIQTPIDVSYLADAILLLRYFEHRGEMRQAISVVKNRGGPHERTVRELRFGPGRIQIGKPLAEFQGVLTGVPRYVGGSEPLLETEKNGSKP